MFDTIKSIVHTIVNYDTTISNKNSIKQRVEIVNLPHEDGFTLRVDNCFYFIPEFEIEGFLIDNNKSGLYEYIYNKFIALKNKSKKTLRKFNWNWKPEWKKRKEIIFRKFN